MKTPEYSPSDEISPYRRLQDDLMIGIINSRIFSRLFFDMRLHPRRRNCIYDHEYDATANTTKACIVHFIVLSMFNLFFQIVSFEIFTVFRLRKCQENGIYWDTVRSCGNTLSLSFEVTVFFHKSFLEGITNFIRYLFTNFIRYLSTPRLKTCYQQAISSGPVYPSISYPVIISEKNESVYKRFSL